VGRQEDLYVWSQRAVTPCGLVDISARLSGVLARDTWKQKPAVWMKETQEVMQRCWHFFENCFLLRGIKLQRRFAVARVGSGKSILTLLAPELFFFLILAHPVYKMWIKQGPNMLELWNKLHFEEEKTESIYHVKNIQYLYLLKKYMKCNV